MPGTVKDLEIQCGDKIESLEPLKLSLVGEAKSILVNKI